MIEQERRYGLKDGIDFGHPQRTSRVFQIPLRTMRVLSKMLVNVRWSSRNSHHLARNQYPGLAVCRIHFNRISLEHKNLALLQILPKHYYLESELPYATYYLTPRSFTSPVKLIMDNASQRTQGSIHLEC